MNRRALGLLLFSGSVSCAPAEGPQWETAKGLAFSGDEVPINTFTTGTQRAPFVVSDKAGNAVIVWTSALQDGSGSAIIGRHFDDRDAPRGSEFRINTYTTSGQAYPAAASDHAGNYVVVWTSFGPDGSRAGVFAQLFDSLGEPRGAEFQVNTYTPSEQYSPAVAMDGLGNFVVAWASWGQLRPNSADVFAQRFDATGAPRGAEFRVNTHTTDRQLSPAVAADAAGNFVVVWQSYRQERQPYPTWGGWGVFGQRYDALGAPRGAEFQVNTYWTSDQYQPSIALDAAGDFVVAWASYYKGIIAQLFDAAGTPRGGEFRVNTSTRGYQRTPSVAASAGGSFVVAWNAADGDQRGTWGAFAQCYDAGGVPRGFELRVNVFTTGPQAEVSVAVDGSGSPIVAWSGEGVGDSSGVFARRVRCDGATADAGAHAERADGEAP